MVEGWTNLAKANNGISILPEVCNFHLQSFVLGGQLLYAVRQLPAQQFGSHQVTYSGILPQSHPWHRKYPQDLLIKTFSRNGISLVAIGTDGPSLSDFGGSPPSFHFTAFFREFCRFEGNQVRQSPSDEPKVGDSKVEFFRCAGNIFLVGVGIACELSLDILRLIQVI